MFRSVICAECADPFLHNQPHVRYCSRVCYVSAKRRRQGRTRARVSIGSRARRRILERDRWVCYLCNLAIDRSLRFPHPRSASVDHVVPLSAGGSNRYANLRAAHWHCNEAKGDSLPGTEVWVPLEAA